MRSSLLALALAAAPALVSAAGTLGFALGDKNADGSCKKEDNYNDDFKALAANTASRIVRGYASNECDTAQGILPAAKTAGFKVVLGIWVANNEDNTAYEQDLAAVTKYAPQYPEQIYAITVGSETLYRGNLTGSQLANKISDVKKQTDGKFKVGTADSWNKYADGTADPLVGVADILLCNAFAYWQGVEIGNATQTFFDDIAQAFQHIQNVAGGADKTPEMWVGETAWPSGGNNYQNAVPSMDNAITYWQKGVCGILAWGVNVFYFEAFDEPWKPKSIGQDGSVADETHWGGMNADRSKKWTLSC